jgi:ABC-type nitrate/sulfonate/bicarbonate transport system substrate-binding protein
MWTIWNRIFQRHVFFLLLSGLFSTVFLAGCSRSETNKQSTDVGKQAILRLGFRPKALADVTPVVIKENSFASPLLAIDLIAVSSPPDGWNKFKTFEVDVLAGMPLASVFDQLAGNGPQRKFIAYFLQVDKNGEGWVAIVANKNLGISSLADLAGKPVATLNTDQAEWLMRRILLAAGVPEGKTNVVRYNPATPLLGLRNSEHAAIFGLEPALSEAVSEGHTILWRGPVSHFLYGDRPVPVSASIVAVDWIEKHSGGYAEFLRMIDQAVKISSENGDTVRASFQKTEYGGLPPTVARSLSLPVMAKPTGILKTVTEQYVDDMLRDGVLKEKINLAPLFPGQ